MGAPSAGTTGARNGANSVSAWTNNLTQYYSCWPTTNRSSHGTETIPARQPGWRTQLPHKA